MKQKKISGGIYLVIDPSMNEDELFAKLSEIINSEIAAVQIWDNFSPLTDKKDLINNICKLCHSRDVPVLVNNDWSLVNATTVDGVHFDFIPQDFQKVKKKLKEGSIIGLTCNNNLSVIELAGDEQLDYISFCSVFPSETSNSCELVSFDTIQKAKDIVDIPVFLAGGIKPENLQQLAELDFDGVAVISGIMSAENPSGATKEYLNKLNQIRHENQNHK